MSTPEWHEVEAILGEVAALDHQSLAAWVENAPENIRPIARSMLEGNPEFGPWAAVAAARLVESTPRLVVPSTLGHYRIVRYLASGGMGDIYEAEDPRLKRRVAIKVLHPGAIRSLEPEAQALARLRHPNICRVYDVGWADGVEYFVMELLDGVPLSERIRKGPLSLGEALSIGRAVASGLAEAHRLGIVHRDVKPANILLTRNGPSLVDFGIAEVAAAGVGLAAGTPPYMAPEQTCGICDARSDIYSLGAVLREVVSGEASPPLHKAIEACLREDPEERWQSAADLSRALDWLLEPVAPAAPAPWWRQWWTGYVAGLLIAMALVAWMAALRESPQPTVLVPLQAPKNYPIRDEGAIAISPDATRYAVIAPDGDSGPFIWIRKLSDPAAEALPATAGASLVFWSPDGQSLGFVRAGQIEILHLPTGKLRTLAQHVPGPPLRAVWGDNDQILYATNNSHHQGVIYHISAAGGVLTPVTALNDAEEELRQGYPVLLPGGNQFLFVAGSNRMAGTADEPGHTYLASIQNPGARKLLLRGVELSGGAGNRIYFIRERQLLSRRLDVASGEWVDNARPEMTGVAWARVTPSGMVMYLPAPLKARPAWVDRRGRTLAEVPVPEGEIWSVDLSADGAVLVTRTEEQSAAMGLWVVRGQNVQRIGSGPGRYVLPAWSSDGKWIYFASYDGTGLHRRSPEPGAEEELLLRRGPGDLNIQTVTRDGRYAFGTALDATTNRGLDICRLDVHSRVRTDWRATEADEARPALSPDDRWIAWQSDADRGRLRVSPRDDPSNITYVTTTAAFEPRWSRDGRELYYFTPDDWLHSVPITVNHGRVVTGVPERLFQLCDGHRFGLRYAVESENRFLVRDVYRRPPDPVLVWRRSGTR